MILDAQALAGNADRAAYYTLFRRYLFDYRTGLELPLYLLIDGGNRACKIYAERPTGAQVRQDVASLGVGTRREALPFSGVYVTAPHRDYFKLGAAFYWAGYPEQALPYFTESLKRFPENERVLLAVGKIHLELGRTAEAKRFLASARALNPSNADVWNELGGASAAEGDLEGALSLYRKALALDPQSPYALLNAAQIAAKLNQVKDAEAWFRQALALDTNSLDASLGLGLLLASAGRYQEAKELFLRLIETNREDESAINNLGVLYMQMGQSADAIAALQYGVKQLPQSELLAMNLARVYAQTGATEKARAVIATLLEKVPRSEAARKALRELEK